MKKSFVLFLTILILGAIAVRVGQNTVLAEKDQVKITENILYGDKSVVEGVTLDLHNHYEEQVFWDTTYVIGEEPKIDTEYTFYQSKQDIHTYDMYGTLYFNDDRHSMGWDGNNEWLPAEGLDIAAQELKDSIGPSEKGTKTVFLKDYLDYYSFDVSFSAPYSGRFVDRVHVELIETFLKTEIMHAKEASGKNYGYTEEAIAQMEKKLEWIETFHEFFKIPVLENEVYTLSMEKDANGNVIGYGMASANLGMGSGEGDIPEFNSEEWDNFEFYTHSYVGDGDVYLTFNTHSYNQQVVDTSLIPGGYGIYYFPYDVEKEEIYPEELQMVYAIDPNVDVIGLNRDVRGENLLLFTMEDVEIYMSMIDIETMTLVEKFNLSENRDDAWGLDYCVLEEDYMVVVTYGDVIVFSIDEDGNYTKEFETSREPLEAFYPEDDEYYSSYLEYDTVYDWNGKQLVFANNMYNINGYMGTNFYVGVMDANGLQYFATYDTSLQSSPSFDENGYEAYNYPHVQPVYDSPVVVRWK